MYTAANVSGDDYVPMAIVTGIVMLMMVFNVIVCAVLRSFLQMDVGHMVLRMTMPYSGEGSRSGS